MHSFPRTLVLSLALILSPMIAFGQEASRAPTCPENWYPATGAMDKSSGEVKWFTCSPFEAYRTILGVSDDVVLMQLSSEDGHQVFALDPVDGSELWRKPTRVNPAAPGEPFGQDTVLLPVDDVGSPALIGVHAETGIEQWRIPSGEIPIAHGATVAVVAAGARTDGTSRLRGLDRATGEELWVSNISLSDASGVRVGRSPAAVHGDIVIVPTGETISAVNLLTGALIWQAPQMSFLVAAEGFVLGSQRVGGPGAKVTALDIGSGDHLWTAAGNASYGGFIAAGDGVAVVLSSDGQEFVAYELATGAERWRVQPDFRAEPQLISETSLIALWEGQIAIVSTIDGATVWSQSLPFGTPLMNSVGSNAEVIVVAINSLPWSD